jgi:hypothetical protein
LRGVLALMVQDHPNRTGTHLRGIWGNSLRHGSILSRVGASGKPGAVQYRDWVKADIFKRLFDAASDEPDMEYARVDATIIKVHRHGQGAKGGLRARPSAAPRAA